MNERKMILPTFPMSEEEHDKYVDLAWKNGKMSLQEQKVREIIDKDAMQYSTGVMVAPTNIDPFIQKIGVHFRFDDGIEAIVQMLFNMALGTLYSIRSQKFVNGEEELELHYTDCQGGHNQLNKNLLEYAGITKVEESESKGKDGKCPYCWENEDELVPLNLFSDGLSLSSEYVVDVTTVVIAGIDVYISEEGNMELLITNSADEPISKKILPIKYCPICGRKLGGK